MGQKNDIKEVKNRNKRFTLRKKKRAVKKLTWDIAYWLGAVSNAKRENYYYYFNKFKAYNAVLSVLFCNYFRDWKQFSWVVVRVNLLLCIKLIVNLIVV